MGKKKNYWNLESIIFNTAETLLIFVMACYFKIDYISAIKTLLVLEISRFYFKLPKHYKDWKVCLLWTYLIISTLLIISKIDATIGILNAIFTAYIWSGKSDISDMYLWKGKTSKYDALRDFVGSSPNNPTILDYEKYWRENYPLRLEIFRYFYRERKSYEEIRDIKNYYENNVIKKECKSIYEQLERPLNLPPIK